MNDLMEETLITIDKVAQTAETDVSVIRRWIKRGLKGPGGEMVILEAIRFGGKWRTSREALKRFIARLTAAHRDAEGTTVALPRTNHQRESAIRKADRKLDELGL